MLTSQTRVFFLKHCVFPQRKYCSRESKSIWIDKLLWLPSGTDSLGQMTESWTPGLLAQDMKNAHRAKSYITEQWKHRRSHKIFCWQHNILLVGIHKTRTQRNGVIFPWQDFLLANIINVAYDSRYRAEWRRSACDRSPKIQWLKNVKPWFELLRQHASVP